MSVKYIFLESSRKNKHFLFLEPKCVLPKLIIRQNIGPISAANNRLLLLDHCRFLYRSNTGPTTATFVDWLNLPTFSRNLAQYRPYTKPIVTFTMACSSESRKTRVRYMDGTLLGHGSLLPRQTILELRKPEFGDYRPVAVPKASVVGQS